MAQWGEGEKLAVLGVVTSLLRVSVSLLILLLWT